MASPEMSAEERTALIKENLAEILNYDIIERALAEGRNPRIYWGTACTGKPHCGYFVPAIKLAQFLKAGCDVVVLIADLHGVMDNLKASLELIDYRAKYYQFVVHAMLKAVGIPTEKVTFVLGSSYQKGSEYVMDLYKLSTLVSQASAKHAGAEIVKQSDSPAISGLIYPLMQVLDEEHLKVDAQFGGMDQRKLFIAAKEWLPKLGYQQRAHLMNPLVPGLSGGKMSSSEPDSKIDLLETPEVVDKKIRKAVAAPQQIEGNGLLAFVEYVLLPASALKGKPEFIVEPRDQEPIVYSDIAQLQADYKDDKIKPQDLKPAVAKALKEILGSIRQEYEASPEWQEITEKAYPEPQKKVKTKPVKKSKEGKGVKEPTQESLPHREAKPE